MILFFLLFQQTASTFHGRPLHCCFLTFSSSLQSFCLESPPTPPFGSDSLTLLLSSLFLSLLLALGFKTNEGGAWGHGGLSPLYPPSSNLDKSFHGPAKNIISRILQPPVLFPPLFPFLILPPSEDYVKQGMRVKGKFSG